MERGTASANAPRLELEEIGRDEVLILSFWYLGKGGKSTAAERVPRCPKAFHLPKSLSFLLRF